MTPPPPFPLLHLPAHLRLQIYHHAFLPPHTTTIGTASPTPTRLNLLLTSRQVYTEALPILHSLLTLHWPTWTTHDFAFQHLASLTPYARSCIRVVAFQMVSVTPSPQTRELKLWKAGFPLIARELGGLRCVRVGVGGFWKGEGRRREVVEEAVAMLRFFGEVEIEVVGVEEGLEVRLGEEVRRRLRCEIRDGGEGGSSSKLG